MVLKNKEQVFLDFFMLEKKNLDPQQSTKWKNKLLLQTTIHMLLETLAAQNAILMHNK